MRIYLSFLILLLAFCSCKKEKQTQQKQVVEIYSDEDFITKVKIIDTACINETERAKEDIRKDQLVYNTHYLYYRESPRQRVFHYYNCEDYVIKELAKLNIKIDTSLIMTSDLPQVHDDFFRFHCYEATMRDSIEKKLGKNYIENLIQQAEKQFVLNNPDTIFIIESRDKGNISAYNFERKQRINLEKQFKYPKNYKPKNEKPYSHTNAYFILMKDGTIRDLKVEATFQNPYNEQFEEYFEKEVRKFVLKTKWEYPLFGGLPANTEMYFSITHK